MGPGDSDATSGGLSDHPVDRLIRELVRSGREASPDEIEQIIGRIAVAPFPTAASHLAVRIAEGQWAEGITDATYTGDLRRAVSAASARLVVYLRRGGHIAAVLARTAVAVTGGHRGAKPLPLLFVVYSADRGIIVSGYQASTVSDISIPKDARWLR